MAIQVASGDAHGKTKGMLVSMSVPLSQNHSPYLPTIASKLYFDQVIRAFPGDLVLAVHIRRNANSHQSGGAFPTTSVCFLILCLLGCK